VTAAAQDLRRVETRFEAAGGRKLFRRAWLPERPDALLVIVHGFGEHSGRYEGLARFFAHRGFAVHAYDQVGHGQSSGRRGHVDAFDWFHDDLERFLALARSEHPGLPPPTRAPATSCAGAWLRPEARPGCAGARWRLRRP